MTASIPSPSSGFFELGPVDVHMYGLMLLLAITVCIIVTGLRWTKRPGAAGGDWDLLLRIAVWGVAAGIVGARAYHVVTSWSEVPDPKWQGVFMVWKGGLGVWGGILLGTIVGAIIARRAGKSAFALMDAAAPGLLLAHGIGRFGNWWNQELFGEPTNRAWGLEIDPENRPFEFAASETFHPTFLYEFLYVTAGAILLLVLDRYIRFKPPALFALYVIDLHVRSLLRGAAADRSLARARPAAPERVGLDRRLHPLDRVLHLVAADPRSAGAASAQAGAAEGAGDGDSQGPPRPPR